MTKSANSNIQINFDNKVQESLNQDIIPFGLRASQPNVVTLAAMKEADEIARKGQSFDDIEDMIRELKL